MAAPARAQADQVAAVLQVVLQQLPDSWDMQTLCSLLQVSTAFRLAVVKARMSCVVGGSLHPFRTADSFAAFCAWLPGHAGLVSELHRHGVVSRHAAAVQVLALALQLCAQQVPPLAATAADRTTPTGLAQPVRELRLEIFRAAGMPSPAVLASLSDLSALTKLEIQGLTSEQPSPVACHSLSRLTGIRSLDLRRSSGGDDSLPAHLGKALSGLQGLQELTLLGCMQPHTMTQLPTQLRDLAVIVRPAAPATEVCVNLSHLNQLTGINLSVLSDYCGQLELPDALVGLSLLIHSTRPVQPTLRLPRLQDFSYSDDYMDALQPQLSAMPQLQHLEICCQTVYDPLSAALSRALSLAVSAVTQLTSLHIERFGGYTSPAELRQPLPDDAELLLRDTLCQLPALRSLALTSHKLQPNDVIQWPSLSGLTTLELRHCPTLGDIAAAALACKLTALQKLELSSCGLQSPVLWPAVTSCTGLHTLNLAGNQLVVNDDTLLILAALTQLTRLDLTGLQVAVSDEGRERFRPVMRQIGVVMGDLL